MGKQGGGRWDRLISQTLLHSFTTTHTHTAKETFFHTLGELVICANYGGERRAAHMHKGARLHPMDDHDDHAYGMAVVATTLAPPGHKESSTPSSNGRATRSWTLFHGSITPAPEVVGKNENWLSASLAFSPKHPYDGRESGGRTTLVLLAWW